VFPVHVAHLAAARGKAGGKRPKSSPDHVRRVGQAVAGIAASAGLAPVFALLLGDVHGDAVAAGVLIGLLSAGLGFGLARVIGRQR
jgi:hypothetical protein